MKFTILSICVLAFLFIFQAQTFAANIFVNLTTDQHDANTFDGFCDIDAQALGDQCTLRAAVEQANALGSNDRIFLFPNSIITLTTANGGEILIEDNGTLEIFGTGAGNLTINGGTGTNRIFSTFEANVIISDVTLTGGGGTGANFSGSGGAIFADDGTLTLNRVKISGNSVPDGAGGGVSFFGGTHRITGSTFSANTARNCGGFNNEDSTLTVVNSTISGNTATDSIGLGGVGGGFCNLGSANATLRNVTITNNTAIAGGGIFQTAGISQNTLNFGNTIIAGNVANSAPEIRFQTGTITSAGYNLVGDSPGDSANPGIPIAYQSSDKQDVNPVLGSLANNGGPTPTHALLAGSPAIDAGLNNLATAAGLNTDQRGTGFSRTRDGNGDSLAFVDIGAFEVQTALTTAASVSVSGRVLASKGRAVAGAIVHLINQSGEVRTVRTTRFGSYSFHNLEAGEIYIFNVYAKRYQFNSKVVTLTEDLAELDFTAQ